MKNYGVLKKMLSEFEEPIRYYLNLPSGFIDMNQQIGRQVSIEHTGFECLACGLNKPIFRMGYCQSCFFTVPEASPSILRPELSRAHLGEEQRDLEWEKAFELQPHIVYLALSGGLKVGVTRKVQIPTRWIDQGASQALVFAETENRYEAGLIEVLLKDKMADKTNWQRMLKNLDQGISLIDEKLHVRHSLSAELYSFYNEDNNLWNFHYPVAHYPLKVKSITLDKERFIEGKLVGIRGQYLYFSDGRVFNVRNHEGYVVDFNIN